jgi:hypothetical protein
MKVEQKDNGNASVAATKKAGRVNPAAAKANAARQALRLRRHAAEEKMKREKRFFFFLFRFSFGNSLP